MQDTQPVLSEKLDSVMLITLNRPERLNAITQDLISALCDALQDATADDKVGAIVLTGAGKAFCAGVDLKALTEDDAVLSEENALPAIFASSKKPIIGALNGPAVTGGLELALFCDFLYAAEGARFGDTHAKVGLMPAWGMSQRLPRLIGINRAREMSLSGKLIDAQTAMSWGLVNKVLPADKLLEEALATARSIANSPAKAVSGIRMLMNAGWNTSMDEGLKLEQQFSQPHNDAVDFTVMSERLSQVRAGTRK